MYNLKWVMLFLEKRSQLKNLILNTRSWNTTFLSLKTTWLKLRNMHIVLSKDIEVTRSLKAQIILICLFASLIWDCVLLCLKNEVNFLAFHLHSQSWGNLYLILGRQLSFLVLVKEMLLERRSLSLGWNLRHYQ